MKKSEYAVRAASGYLTKDSASTDLPFTLNAAL